MITEEIRGGGREEEGDKKKIYETGTTQWITMRYEEAANTGYAGKKNASSDGSHRIHPHHQHRDPFYN